MNIRNRKKQIKRYLSSLEVYDITLKFGDENMFDADTSSIMLDISGGDYSDFRNLCRELGYKGNDKTQDLCFFHELGHYFTWQRFSKKDEDYDNIIREHLNKAMVNDNNEIQDTALRCYFRLPQEIEATKFGLKLLEGYNEKKL